MQSVPKRVKGLIRFTVLAILLSLALIALTGCSKRQASSQADLDNLLENAKKDGKIVMLELGSVGCIPCENMKPVMERLRKNYGSKLEVIFVDVKEQRQIGTRYGVYMIPVQVFLDREGKEFYRHVGFFPYEEIPSVIEEQIK